ncbi:WD repeat-containing protein 27 [Blastocladiella emersonii ATCC 22665]|nr:WD repeat-containing protein 27 [Blastocladiella emersonii ATCC 22665]
MQSDQQTAHLSLAGPSPLGAHSDAVMYPEFWATAQLQQRVAVSRLPVLATHRLPGGAATGVAWSYNESMVVTSTASTVSVWRTPSSASAAPLTAAAIEDARILNVSKWYSAGETVSAAQFFYHSKFLLIAAGDRVELLKYRTSAADTVGGRTNKRKLLTGSAALADLAPRQLATSMTKRVWSAAAPDGSHEITAMAACNTTPSPLIVCATSGKTLCIADANTGTIVTKIASSGGRSGVTLEKPGARFLPPHATVRTAIPPSLARHPPVRAIHAIRVIDPAFCTTPGAAHLFMTTAAGDLVKLWDVRTASPVVQLGAALPAPRGARTMGSGASISPCSTLVAAPTGDASCAIAVFDVRNAQIAAKLPAAVSAMSAARRRVAGPAAGAGRRAGSAMGSGSSAARASPAFGSSTASTGVVPVVPTMGGEDAGAVDFHPIRSALVAGTTRGNGVLFRL